MLQAALLKKFQLSAAAVARLIARPHNPNVPLIFWGGGTNGIKGMNCTIGRPKEFAVSYFK
jgi:hypothetical protein